LVGYDPIRGAKVDPCGLEEVFDYLIKIIIIKIIMNEILVITI